MIPLSVEAIAGVVGAREVVDRGTGSDPTVLRSMVHAVMTDTRVGAAEPAVFFALRTERADGHDHVGAAATAGAVAAVVERPIPDAPIVQIVVQDSWVAIGALGRRVVDTVGCSVVGITGSYGKTTVKDLCSAALATERRVAASHASFNNELGVPLTMLSVVAGVDVLVAEAGARNAGDIGVLGRLLAPDVAVITAVGPVHLETFGDEEGVAKEKSRLVGALRRGGVAVLNGDDARVAAMAELAPRALMVSAQGRPADLRASDVSSDPEGRVRARVRTPWGETRVELPMPGAHHLTNAMLALAVAGLQGVDLQSAAAGIATATTSPSRSALRMVGGITLLDDAYNASPPTMLGALETLAALPCTGRRWAVLGQMAELGPASEAAHLDIGRACASRVDELVVVGSEAAGIAQGAQEAGLMHVRRVGDHAEAAGLVTAEVRSGDTVLFKASRVATLDRAAAAVAAALEGGVAA